jgi:hypothetical protein
MPTLATIKADTRRAALADKTAGVPFDSRLPIEGYIAITDSAEVLPTAAIHDTLDCTAGQNGPGNLYSIQEIDGAYGHGQLLAGVLELNGPQIDAMLTQGWHRCRGPVCRRARGEA